MSDQSKLGIGQLITDEPKEKDAIHVAVAPVVCGDAFLVPGEHVGIIADEMSPLDYAVVGVVSKTIGIVDPFLPARTKVHKGQQFWLFLYPGSIINLRHDWTHEAFFNLKTSKGTAYDQFEQLVSKMNAKMAANFTSDYYLEVLDDIYAGRYASITFSIDLNYDDFENNIQYELWTLYGLIRGVDVDHLKGQHFFRCAC